MATRYLHVNEKEDVYSHADADNLNVGDIIFGRERMWVHDTLISVFTVSTNNTENFFLYYFVFLLVSVLPIHFRLYIFFLPYIYPIKLGKFTIFSVSIMYAQWLYLFFLRVC